MVEKGPCAIATNVSKPEKHGSGRSAIVDYLVTTSFVLDGGKSKSTTTNESLVRRTFEDFQWIQKRLVQERMGIIVPVLSNKKPAQNKDQFFESFITMRQESFDRFLQRVIHHSELVGAPSLLPFFTANPTDWNVAKERAVTDKELLLKENTTADPEDELASLDSIQIDAHAVMHSPVQDKKKGPMRRWLANKRTQWALQNENLILEETPSESKKFTDMKTYADHLEVCARILSEDYKELLSSNAVLAEKTGTMGAAFAQMWGEHEIWNTSSSNLYQSLGQVWANVGNTIKTHVSFGERYFENPVDDLVMDVAALQDALLNRKEALYTFTKLTQQGATINKQLDNIRAAGNMTIQQDRYYKLETALRHCDNKIEESRNHSDLVTTRLERDIERFRVEWHERMRQVLEVFHKQQVEFLQSQVKDFSSVLPALATLDSNQSDLATKPSQPEKTEINMTVASGGAKASVGAIPLDQNESYTEQNNVSSNAPVPVSPLAGELPSPTATTYGDSPALQSIALNASFSSDDGFGAAPAMGGETSSNDETDTSSSKPIVKSV